MTAQYQIGGIDTDILYLRKDDFTNNGLWLWGNNSFGQLGDNTIANKSSPVQTIAGGTNWKQVSAGVSQTVAIKTDGTLWSWGNNALGQLGDNTVFNKSSPVQTITGGTNWKQVACGYRHTAAIKTDGTLWSWGLNIYGQLGDNTVVMKSSPVQTITGGTNWKQVSTGGHHTAAIKTDGTLWSWGFNIYGQLGDNTVVMKSSPVQTVAGGTNWKQVSTGGYHTAAIKTDGTIWTWGNNSYGHLGDNTVVMKSSPVQTIAGGTNWKQVSAGVSQTVAIKTDGTLWTWGNNSYGHLGDNTLTQRSSPVQTIAGGTNWKQVACGYRHTAAIKTDGTLWSWGFNNYGALGDNTLTYRSSPVQTVTGGTNWKQVAGYYHTAAIIDIQDYWPPVVASGVTVNLTITSNTKNYNIFANKGGTYSAGITTINLTVNSGIIIGSTSTATYALDTGTGWATGDVINIINNGYICGKGGTGGDGGGWGSYNGGAATSGGPAINLQWNVNITNASGYIYSGGGGGGGQAGGNITGGHGGGGGAGNSVGSAGGGGSGSINSMNGLQGETGWLSKGGAGIGGGGGGGAGNALLGVNAAAGLGGGGGGGASGAGYASQSGAYGGHGKAINLNARTVTYISGNTRVYGGVS